MKLFLSFLAASLLALQVDASLLENDDGLEEHHDADDNDDKGFLRRDLGREPKIKVCHLERESDCGFTYKTLSVSRNAKGGHAGHGDYVDDGCGGPNVCSNLCNHRPCYFDFMAGSDMCQCFADLRYLCGGNTYCNGDVCTCIPGYESSPGSHSDTGGNADNSNVGCTDIDDCTVELEPCYNGGICTDAGVGTYTCACAPGFDGERCQIELCQTKVYTQAGGQLTYPTAGDNTYDCDVLCLGDYSWTRNFNQNLNQNSPILIHDAFDVDGDTHFLKSITVSASNAQICVSPKTGVIAPRPSLGAPFLAKVNAVTVGEFEDESNVLRTENGCQCYEYADFDCREYVYTPVDDLCLAYTFNGDNTLTVDGLVYNTVNSITVAVEVCQGSNPLSCP
jgi:hypothetical protein